MIVRILCPNYWVSGHEIGLTGSVGIALSIQNLIQLVFTSILRDSLVLCKSVKRLPQRFRFVPVKVQIPWHSLLMFVPMLLKESVLKVVHIRVLHSRPKFLEMFFFWPNSVVGGGVSLSKSWHQEGSVTNNVRVWWIWESKNAAGIKRGQADFWREYARSREWMSSVNWN